MPGPTAGAAFKAKAGKFSTKKGRTSPETGTTYTPTKKGRVRATTSSGTTTVVGPSTSTSTGRSSSGVSKATKRATRKARKADRAVKIITKLLKDDSDSLESLSKPQKKFWTSDKPDDLKAIYKARAKAPSIYEALKTNKRQEKLYGDGPQGVADSVMRADKKGRKLGTKVRAKKAYKKLWRQSGLPGARPHLHSKKPKHKTRGGNTPAGWVPYGKESVNLAPDIVKRLGADKRKRKKGLGATDSDKMVVLHEFAHTRQSEDPETYNPPLQEGGADLYARRRAKKMGLDISQSEEYKPYRKEAREEMTRHDVRRGQFTDIGLENELVGVPIETVEKYNSPGRQDRKVKPYAPTRGGVTAKQAKKIHKRNKAFEGLGRTKGEREVKITKSDKKGLKEVRQLQAEMKRKGVTTDSPQEVKERKGIVREDPKIRGAREREAQAKLKKAAKKAARQGVPAVVPKEFRKSVAKYGPMLQDALDEAGVDMTGAEYLGRLIEFESGWSPTAENPSSAYGLGQFIDSTAEDFRSRLGVETQNPNDPDSMIKGAAMHASGKFGYNALYAGYNPGYSSTDPILSVDAGPTLAGKPIPKKTLKQATAALGKQATKQALGQRTATSGKPIKQKPGEWAGSEDAVLSIIPKAFRAEGKGDKRTPEENASVGGSATSDHLTTNELSYAADLPADDALARTLAARVGMPSHLGTNEVVKDGYRYQLIWQDEGHYDHVHFGAEWVGEGVPEGTVAGGTVGATGSTIATGGGIPTMGSLAIPGSRTKGRAKTKKARKPQGREASRLLREIISQEPAEAVAPAPSRRKATPKRVVNVSL